MTEEKISNRQLWFILFMMRSTVILAFLPILTSANALQDAWISALVTLVGSEIIVLLIALLSAKFPELTVIEYSRKLLGKWGGKIFSLIYLWLFLQLAVVELRLYGEVITTTFLTQTPLIFINGIMVVASTICIYNGIEVLGRMADILFFIFITMILGVILFPLPNINLGNIQPVLARGWTPIFRGVLTPMVLISQMWVIGIITPHLISPKKIVSTSLTAIGASLAILTIFAVIIIGVLGPHTGARATFPILSLMRSVQVSKFLQRAEVLVIFSWGFGLFISVSTYLYAGVKGVALWLNLKDYRPLVFPMAVIWTFMSIHNFEDVFSLNQFLKPETLTPYYGFLFLIFPLILLWTGYGFKLIINEIKGGE